MILGSKWMHENNWPIKQKSTTKKKEPHQIPLYNNNNNNYGFLFDISNSRSQKYGKLSMLEVTLSVT